MRTAWTLLTISLSQLFFWSWNLMFGFIVVMALPSLAWTLLEEAWRGALPWDLAGVSLALLAAPFLMVAAWIPIAAQPAKISRLLFGVEAPLVLAGLVRLTLLREVTPSVAYLLLVIGLAGFALVLDLYRRRTTPLSLPELAGHAVLLVTAGWVGGALAFYIPPTVIGLGEFIGEVASEAASRVWLDLNNLGDVPMFIASVSLIAVTMAGFAILPVAFFSIYLGTFVRLFRETAGRSGSGRALAASVVGVGLTLAPVFVLDRHPQLVAFGRLAGPPADDAARAALLADEDVIREGLLNAYLAKHRYWTSTGTSNHIRHLYPEAWADGAQDLYNALTSPFVYRGESMEADRDRAAELYANYFDVPLQKGEQAAVLRAMNATWDRSTVEAGLLDVNGEKVLLARQELTVAVTGDIATVQLDEVYRNQTDEQQEIFYYFSLPESAAVTGLWLSDDLAWPDKYPGLLAPRGAAQQVYLEQRQERRDPALLEQVGPRQYRLRAFPILRRPWHEDEGPPLTVRLTYTTLVGPDGVPLPTLTERRNVYWDGRTERLGVTMSSDAWLPATVPASAAQKPHAVAVGEGLVVTATPASPAPVTVTDHRYAVVLDRSLSMRAHAEEVEASLAWLRENVAPRNHVELYSTAGWGAGEAARADTLAGQGAFAWFGSIEPHTMLAQYDALRAGRTYDAVLVLTDAGTYDLAVTDPPPVPATGGPLWFVHLGGALAPAYDDSLLQAIQGSHGGVATSVAEVFTRLSAPSAEAGCADVIDGYLWCVREGAPDAPAGADPTFAALAARAYVLHQARTTDMADVANLDAVHRAAKAVNIVTPYSSLIALVDEVQRKRLAELEAQEDRFTREAESGVESLTAPSDAFAVTAVPEPEEWALLIVACGIVLVARGRRARSYPLRGSSSR